MKKLMKTALKLLGIFTIAAALMFALASCDNGSGDPPPKIPSEYQNTTWNNNGNKLVLKTETVVVTSSGGVTKTYTLDTVTNSSSGTLLMFKTTQSESAVIMVKNGVIVSAQFSFLPADSGYGWTAGESSGSDLTGSITISPPTSVTIGTELTATYSGTETVTYQWKKDGSAISGATSGKYTPEETGSYTVTVSAAGKSKTSDPVTVINKNLPDLTGSITISPSTGVTTDMELTANYSGTETVTYQWNKDGSAISGSTSNKYTPDEAGSYTVTVSAAGKSKTSAAVTVTQGSYPSEVTVQGADLAAKLDWIKNNARSDTTYFVTVDKNEELGGVNNESSSNSNNLSYAGKSNITVQLQGTGGEKAVSLSSNGCLFYVASGVTLILDKDIILKDKSDPYLVYVYGGALVMKTGAKIFGSNGTGVHMYSGTFTMEGGEISGNKNGGVYVYGGTFTMSGGKISGNGNTASFGGGVDVYQSGTFTMEGGEISGNSGRGVHVYGGTFTMKSGKISGNTDGGVNVRGTFTMEGGEISGNTAVTGGGVYVSGGGTFTMKSGRISGNTVSRDIYSEGRGGGVYVYQSGTFTMEGGEISGNTASYCGGGVCVWNLQETLIKTTFTKTGGTITGYANDKVNGNVVKDNSGVVSDLSHTVFFMSDYYNRLWYSRETTAGPTVNMDSSKTDATGGWEHHYGSIIRY